MNAATIKIAIVQLTILELYYENVLLTLQNQLIITNSYFREIFLGTVTKETHRQVYPDYC